MKSVALVLLVGCGEASVPVPAPVTVAEPSVSIDLDTDPGLSDLALAPDGSLWTESERGRSIYRLTLDGDALATQQRFDVTNVPDGDDIEAITLLAADRFALGTETHGVGSAAVWFATLGDTALDARGGFEITGVQIDDNNGIEGICADDQIVVAAIETVIEDGDARYAPVVVQRTDVARDLLAPAIDRVKLTSDHGKLSALSCTLGEQELELLAIERHYDVSRLISFTLPRYGDATVDATVVRDLTALSEGRNFEGVARLADGRIALIVDNQTAKLSGPSQLVLLPASL